MQPSFLLSQKNVSKINDCDANGCSNLGKEEIIERCKLATVFRLVDIYGWCETIFNHISLRTTNEKDLYLTNPFGLLYSEITASQLLKVNVNGEIIRAGSSALGCNSAGFTLHSAIHEGRSDINCIIHLHHPDVVAVSAMKCGLLPISQQSMILGDVSYHPYSGILVDEFEKKQIIKNLGKKNKVMILENHGVVACGKDVEEAFAKLLLVISSCCIQVECIEYSNTTNTSYTFNIDQSHVSCITRKTNSARQRCIKDSNRRFG